MRSFTGWVEQVKRFYDNILENDELKNGMMEYGYPEPRLRQERDQLDQVYAKHLQQTREMGQAQDATKARDKALDELAVFVSDLRAIARVALSDTPQQLEMLGIMVKSRRAASSKAETPEPDDTDEPEE
jgi:hypothetical protein